MIAKRDSVEKVGNVVELGGRLMVIEYSDLPDDVAAQRTADGSLAIWAGSIAVHVFDLAFLTRMAASAESLPFHAAYKKTACLDAAGRHVQPQTPNAVKFERFIFDLMPSAARAIVVEVDPAQAFAPLKNASGTKDDTPETVKAQMSALHRGWLCTAGVETFDGAAVEINPLFAIDAEELAGRVRSGTRVTESTYFFLTPQDRRGPIFVRRDPRVSACPGRQSARSTPARPRRDGDRGRRARDRGRAGR